MSAAAGCFNVGHMCVRIPRKEGEVQKIACPGSIHEKPFSSLIYYKAEERCLVCINNEEVKSARNLGDNFWGF